MCRNSLHSKVPKGRRTLYGAPAQDLHWSEHYRYKDGMTPQEFITKWLRANLSERSACQQHFLDICDLLGQPKPAEADPDGTFYTFERGVHKTGGEQGWADVWMRGHFAGEYKGKRKSLAAAYDQSLEYREDLENPPLLVICDRLFDSHCSRASWQVSITARPDQNRRRLALYRVHAMRPVRRAHRRGRLKLHCSLAYIATQLSRPFPGMSDFSRHKTAIALFESLTPMLFPPATRDWQSLAIFGTMFGATQSGYSQYCLTTAMCLIRIHSCSR